jgi:copper chaperone
MSKVEYFVPNISCGHCVHTIEMEVGELPGVSSVEAFQDSKKVIVEFGPPTTEEKIESLLMEIDYPPQKI